MGIVAILAAGAFVLFVLLEGSATAQSSATLAPASGSGSSSSNGGSCAGVEYDPCVCPSQICTGGCGVITSDPGTWPSGDDIWTFAQAIAYAEGANIAGSVPDRTNNPGDISDGSQTYGSLSADGSNVTTFPDKQTGWQWLYNKLKNIADGNSTVYSPNMTIAQMAQAWAGNSGAWANNVAARLGVGTGSVIGPLLGNSCCTPTSDGCCPCCG